MFRRFPFVKQNDGSDCGAAALATVALFHKMPTGLERLRDLAGTDRVGTTLWGLAQAAGKLGFSTKAVKGPYEALPQVPVPAIAHMKTDEGLGHFVVLYRANKRGVIVADPERGLRKLARDEFTASWTGHLLIMVPEPEIQRSCGEHGAVSSWRRFVQLLAAHKSVFAEAFCCALMMTALGVVTSYFVQHLVDSVLVRGETRLLNALGLGMILIVLFRTLFGVLRQYLLAHVGRKIDLTLIAGYARHILKLPLHFFERRRVGEILSRVNDAAKIRDAISGTTLTLAVDGVLVLLSLGVLWLYDTPLAAVATLFVPLMIGSVAVHHSGVKRRSRDAMENTARFSSHLVENISGVETLKAFGLEDDRSETGESQLVQLVQNIFSLEKMGISMSGAGTLITGVAGITILWFGGHRVISGALTIGQLMFFYTLLGYMLDPLLRLAAVNLQLQDALVAIDRLYQVLEIEPEQESADQKVILSSIRQGIELQNVDFRYGCRGNVLTDMTLEIPAGKTIAIVGESGCGKSTLLKLLMRFSDPTEGRVTFDGIDARDIELASLRSRIGLVSQDPFVFTGTIRENIALGQPDATMQEIVDAARAAGLDNFILQLPDRYETIIGERGANLSGGQRQRLAIARALLRKPDVLIFDEATSHLDTSTERAIQQSLKSALSGRTVVLVAHRLSTIQDADVIYVVDGGAVAECGTHQQLIARNGRYTALWQAQSVVPRRVAGATESTSHNGTNGHTVEGKTKHELQTSL